LEAGCTLKPCDNLLLRYISWRSAMARKGDNGDGLGFPKDDDGGQGLVSPTDVMYGADTDSPVDSSSASYSGAPREPRKTGISKEERAGLIAAARMGDRSSLLQPKAEGSKRTGKGEYNPDKFVPTRRIMPVRFSSRQDTGENIDIAPSDVTAFGGSRGYAPITASVEQSIRGAGVSSQLDEARTGTFSAEDPAILRGLTDQKYDKQGNPLPRTQRGINTRLDAKVERHNIVANAIQDRNARRLQEHMERHRPLNQPKVVSEGVRTGQERFRRTDTGQEVATGPNVGPPSSGGGRPLPGAVPAETERQKGREKYAERKEAAASRGKILEYSQMSGGDIERGGIPRSEMTRRVPASPLGSESNPYTAQQESNISAQRDSLRRQRAAEVQAETDRASGKDKRDSRMREAEAARRTADAPTEMDLPDESQLPTPTLGGRPREQRAALIQASAAMRGRMPLVSTADPEQVNRGARAAAQRYTETSRMFEAEPRRIEGGGRGPRSFLDPEATAGRRGDLRNAQASDFAFGEDPEQIDVDMSNQILGAVRRQTETEGILSREMTTDSAGIRLGSPPASSRGYTGSLEREARDLVKESKDPYMTGAEAFGRVPVIGQQFDRGQPGVVKEVLRSGEGAMSRRTAVAAEERRSARLSAERERGEERSREQRTNELARRERERAGSASAPRPAREQGPNTISTPGPDDTSRIAKEISDRAMAGENLADLKREYGID
jgi:hypothetical protein